MLVGTAHGVKDTLNVLKRHLIVKEITHGIDKNETRPLPFKWCFEYVRMEGNLEAVSVLGHPYCLQPSRHPLGVAVLTPGTDFVAAGDRVPRSECPLDF